MLASTSRSSGLLLLQNLLLTFFFFFFCSFVSATYQWGGVARLDLVSAPPGTALAFYGPSALHVHAMPLLSQHDLVQSAAALAAQPRTSQHDSAQHEAATKPRSQQNDSLTSHSSEQHDAADSHLGMFGTDQNLPQAPHAADSEADDVTQAQHSLNKQWQKEEEYPDLQAELTGLGHQRKPAGEEDKGSDEGLFAETSVLARGGLKVTEKASLTALDCLVRVSAVS